MRFDPMVGILLAVCSCRPMAAKDADAQVQEGASVHNSKSQPIVIDLSGNDRDDPALDVGGHQPWRAEEWSAADVALRDFFSFPDDVLSDAAAARLLIVEASRDGTDRSTRIIETPLDRPVANIARPVARIHMTRQPRGAWVATRIIVRER